MSAPLRVISLGAGVQSTTMALMAAHGLINGGERDHPQRTVMPDAAVFADTKDEGGKTYKHLGWLTGLLPFPVHTGTKGSLSEALFSGDDEARIPAFVKAGGMSTRQCTRNFKLVVIRREYRKILGVGQRSFIAPGAVEQWIGISTDEASRIKPSGRRYITNRYPLIEMGFSRAMCERWLLDHGYPIPPKSACVYCAFQGHKGFAHKKMHEPEDFEMACSVDDRLRTPENIARFRGELYLHNSCKPLRDVDFTIYPDRQFDMFNNECEAMCGV